MIRTSQGAARVLVVDACERRRFVLHAMLVDSGFEVRSTPSPQHALRFARATPADVVVAADHVALEDDGDPRSFSRALRNAGVDSPMVIVGSDVVRAVRVARAVDAHGFMVLPRDLEHVAAHIAAVVPRRPAARRLRIGPIELDEGTLSVTVNGVERPMTDGLYRILHALMIADGRVVGDAQLDAVRKRKTNGVRVQMRRLRSALGPIGAAHLRTARRAGYYLVREIVDDSEPGPTNGRARRRRA